MQTMSFVLGLLVGAVVATAWPQIPVAAGPDTSGYAAPIDPMEITENAQSLPVETHDAF
jgi:hypothetical protein